MQSIPYLSKINQDVCQYWCNGKYDKKAEDANWFIKYENDEGTTVNNT
jgi:hypothetical protein